MVTREQSVARAQESAAKLFSLLEGERLVAQFVDSYVAECERPGLKAGALRYRELLVTLRRESLLAMAARVTAELPRLLTRRPPRRAAILSGADAESAEAFREEFFAALAKSLAWSPADLEEFRRDLDLYAHISARQRARPGRPARGPAAVEGPFVDRCALLLDPSLLEKARQAAGRFQVELEHLTDKVLKGVFTGRREPRATEKPRGQGSRPRKRKS